MLQTNDIQHRLILLERAVAQAAQACSAERAVPGELRQCMARIDAQSDAAMAAMAAGHEVQLHKLVHELGALSERAQRVCDNITSLSPQLKSAVRYMHSQLLELKHDFPA